MKLNLKQKVWIVKPLCHGNGGWYGSKILSSLKGMQLKRALSINTIKSYGFNDDNGYLGAIRICRTKDPNHGIYYFDTDDCKWVKM